MLTIKNPANGTVVAEYEEDSAAEIADKYQRARAAQRAWQQTPLAKRAEGITRFQGLLCKGSETQREAARVLSVETGKPIGQARYEVGATPDRIQFFLNNVEHITTTESVHEIGTLREAISQEPLGVIANISAWNYPYFVGSNVFVPALLTGSCVLYKPSEFALGTGLMITSLLHQAGIPEDVFIPVIGGGSAGRALLAQPLDGVFFTGSHATGKHIAQALAGRMIKYQMELGGKDPIYICEDADIPKAAQAAADGAFYNAGQSCCSVERIYVHQSIKESFTKAFEEAVSKFVIGDPLSEDTYIGPLTRPQQIQVLENQISDAQAKGAHLLCGGKAIAGEGNFFEPTVLTNVDHSMSLMQEESFGPLIGIQAVNDDAEAIERMNDTEYGLTSGVFSPNEQRARDILNEINSGTVYWNCCDRVSPNLPWSGRGHSGLGTTLSLEGFRTFLQPKAWHLRSP